MKKIQNIIFLLLLAAAGYFAWAKFLKKDGKKSNDSTPVVPPVVPPVTPAVPEKKDYDYYNPDLFYKGVFIPAEVDLSKSKEPDFINYPKIILELMTWTAQDPKNTQASLLKKWQDWKAKWKLPTVSFDEWILGEWKWSWREDGLRLKKFNENSISWWESMDAIDLYYQIAAENPQ